MCIEDMGHTYRVTHTYVERNNRGYAHTYRAGIVIQKKRMIFYDYPFFLNKVHTFD